MEKKNILLIDDDDIANFLVERVVADTGLANKIYKALNGQEGLKLFTAPARNNHTPDVILLDLNMPIMNGFEFVKAFHELESPTNKRVLIILVTSSSNPEDIDRARELGIKHYLVKPISTESVRRIILSEFNDATSHVTRAE